MPCPTAVVSVMVAPVWVLGCTYTDLNVSLGRLQTSHLIKQGTFSHHSVLLQLQLPLVGNAGHKGKCRNQRMNSCTSKPLPRKRGWGRAVGGRGLGAGAG